MIPSARTWHDLPTEGLAGELGTDADRGLAAAEARRRLAADGANAIEKESGPTALAIFAAQFRSLVIWVLIGAAAVSAALGEYVDGVAIVTIVVLNACVGFVQEYRANKAAAALARLTAPRARVVRDGVAVVVPAMEVVRGDVLLLDGGDLVAADARLVAASALRVIEAPLTGESSPVDKQVRSLPQDTGLADRSNMVFLGTSIAAGTGRALVVATGMQTELGRIASLLGSAQDEATPLQRRLDRVAARLLWACVAIVLVVFVLGLLRGVAPFEMFLSAVSLAIAAVPEGLPAVVTVALALGVQRMARRKALVRRLQAVEALGCAEVICTDKTGTLTVGQMTVRVAATPEHLYQVSGQGYEPAGAFTYEGTPAEPAAIPLLAELLKAGVACNDAELREESGRWAVIGDPTEGALLVAAAKAGMLRATVESAMPRIATRPFDSERKRMTIVRRSEDGLTAWVKGAPEVILERCTRVLTPNGRGELTAAERAQVANAAALMANDALRVIAVASREVTETQLAGGEDLERDLTLLGLFGMVDPPRPEARAAVGRCRQAGIRTVMITGDHPATARAIAHELGIAGAGDAVMVGNELDALDDAALARRAGDVAVYARVTAEHKLRIVRAWKARGAVVAMTGDGVNDAPALKEASIGIAMAGTGTEVTKEAADIIVTDDNFASIVDAVEEGRGIYDNIAKTLGYLLAGNAGELIVMLVAGVVGWPLPLLPLHLLWINLVTDGLPALALATDPVDAGVLRRPPRARDAELIDRSFLRRTAVTGILTAAVTMLAFAYELYVDENVEHARDAAFTVLVIAEVMRSFGARSDTRTLWDIGMMSNVRLVLIALVTLTLQISIHHVAPLQRLFDIEPVSAVQCVAWTLLGCVPLLVLEALKAAAPSITRPPSSQLQGRPR